MGVVCVIGGANIDICGSSNNPLRNYDSNPGKIALSYGGVGRNIAQICALLDQKVRFVSCFSSDNYGQMMKKDCEHLGMDCSYSKIVDTLPSSMYIAILDHNRDMKIAMSDMRILREMDEEMLENVLHSLGSEDSIIIDANLDMECIEYIVKHAHCSIAADPVSANKASRLKAVLPGITIFKPNQYEAKELTGIEITDEKTAQESLEWFLNLGVKEILISMADKGLLLGTPEKKVWYTHRRIELENATGGGDTLLGAYVSKRLEGIEPHDAIKFAISASVSVIEQDAVNRRSLNVKDVEKKIDNMEIKEKKL